MIGGGIKMSAHKTDPIKEVPKLVQKESEDSALRSYSKKISTEGSSSGP